MIKKLKVRAVLLFARALGVEIKIRERLGLFQVRPKPILTSVGE